MQFSFDSSDPDGGWTFHATDAQAVVVAAGELERLSLELRPSQRLVGFFSYDFGRMFEELPATAKDDLRLPMFAFKRVEDCGEHMSAAPLVMREGKTPSTHVVRSTFSRDGYVAAVKRSLDYIAAGDVFQVNLSQRFTTPLVESPLTIYQRLQHHSPAVYGAFLDFGDFQIISNSPELFLRVIPLPDGRKKVITRPIKGTRARLEGRETELRTSIKDQAELNMIIDLERNDLGRVCEIGSVRVVQGRTVEAHPTVYHGVATIEGILRRDVTLYDLLRATFPGGSVTGAPKIRAMEIIEELEPVRRGPYCGAIGYITGDGSMEFNVAIRTMIVKDGLIHIPVGGGIVADSIPEEEYEETLLKAQAMFAAVGISAEDIAQT